jgi:hypothetical protein
MKTEEELRERLREAVDARRQLLQEEMQAEKTSDDDAIVELRIEIANLSGVITTLEWALDSGAAPEYE